MVFMEMKNLVQLRNSFMKDLCIALIGCIKINFMNACNSCIYDGDLLAKNLTSTLVEEKAVVILRA